MTFLVVFADGDKSWVQYGPDLTSNTTFQEYVDTVPELMPLRYTALEAGRYIVRSRRLAIPMTMAPKRFLLDLRVLGFTWYDSLHLPQSDTALYLLEAHFVEYLNKQRTRAKVYFPALEEEMSNLDYAWFEMNATRIFLPEDAIFVDELFLVRFPQIIGDSNKERQKTLERLYSPVLAGSPANRRGVYRSDKDIRPSENGSPLQPRRSPRMQLDDNVPDVHDGNDVLTNRRILQRQISTDIDEDVQHSKRLVQPVTSRRYTKDIQEVNTGARVGLRKRNKQHNKVMIRFCYCYCGFVFVSRIFKYL